MHIKLISVGKLKSGPEKDLVDDYVSCWQQGLANGETDASICDHGTSRWFNYYLEGKHT